jgi:hypothetical protein
VTNAHGTNYGLVYAALQNYANAVANFTATTPLPLKFVLPTAVASAGTYNTAVPAAPTAYSGSGPTAGTSADPSAWVQPPSKLAAVATPTSLTGYPIVGTTQILTYTCYADTQKNSDVNVGYKLNRFLYFYLKNPIVTGGVIATTPGSGGILATYGFAPLGGAFRSAEYAAFVKPGSASVASPITMISPKSDLIQANGNKVTITFKHNAVCDSLPGA